MPRNRKLPESVAQEIRARYRLHLENHPKRLMHDYDVSRSTLRDYIRGNHSPRRRQAD